MPFDPFKKLKDITDKAKEVTESAIEQVGNIDVSGGVGAVQGTVTGGLDALQDGVKGVYNAANHIVTSTTALINLGFKNVERKTRNVAAGIVNTAATTVAIGGVVGDVALNVSTGGGAFLVAGPIVTLTAGAIAKQLEQYAIELKKEEPQFLMVSYEQKGWTGYELYGLVNDPVKTKSNNESVLKLTEQEIVTVLKNELTENDADRVNAYLDALESVQWYKFDNGLQLETARIIDIENGEGRLDQEWIEHKL